MQQHTSHSSKDVLSRSIKKYIRRYINRFWNGQLKKVIFRSSNQSWLSKLSKGFLGLYPYFKFMFILHNKSNMLKKESIWKIDRMTFFKNSHSHLMIFIAKRSYLFYHSSVSDLALLVANTSVVFIIYCTNHVEDIHRSRLFS